MIKKITSSTLSSLLLITTFNGCTENYYNPSKTGFIGSSIGIVSGIFDDRISIFGQRVKIAKDEYFETLLEYQEMVAEITKDNRQVVQLRENINLMNKHSDRVEKMINNISVLEKSKSVSINRGKIREQKEFLKSEVDNFTQTLQKVAEVSVVSRSKKTEVVRKLNSGSLTKRQSVVLKKFMGNRNIVLAKVEQNVQSKLEKAITLSSSLRRNIDNSDSNQLKERGIGLLLTTKSIHKTKEIHVEKRRKLGIEVEKRRKLGVEVEKREN